MQLTRTGIGLIAFFGLAGLAFIFAPAHGEASGILKLLGLIWVVVAGGLGMYARRQARQAAHNDEIFRTGIRGTATVISASSGATVNEMPVMKLDLELAFPGQDARRAVRREIMPAFAAQRMRAGLILPAYSNVANPQEFILVW